MLKTADWFDISAYDWTELFSKWDYSEFRETESAPVLPTSLSVTKTLQLHEIVSDLEQYKNKTCAFFNSYSEY